MAPHGALHPCASLDETVSCSLTLSLLALCQLPLWALVSLGTYSLASIGYQLFIFRECPEAFKELEKVRQHSLLTATLSAAQQRQPGLLEPSSHAAC